MVGRDCEERWINHLSRKLGLADFASRGMEAADINPLAVTLTYSPGLAVMHILEPRVGADIHEKVVVLRGSSLDIQKRESDKQNESVSDTSHEGFLISLLRASSYKAMPDSISSVPAQTRWTRERRSSGRSWWM